MKKLYPFIIVFCFSFFHSNAQKRNNIKVIGIGFDNVITATAAVQNTSNYNMDIPFLAHNTFNWGIGYERLLGNRLVLGANFWKYFSAQTNDINSSHQTWNSSTGVYTTTVFYQPAAIPNYYFNSFSYKSSGFNLGFESKYYFKEHDEDGANGVYMASSYQLSQIQHEFVTATYIDSTVTMGSNSLQYSFPTTTTYLNRFGLKLGISGSSFISTDFFIGMNYILPANFDQNYISPITNREFNFYIGWQIGVPF